ncbi:MAG: hypothetical protein AVDCRST_MAG39-210 [uncultured Sphingomonadaceae bacterium]|uniref:EpsG family protein n=1 Tax=uncultured Sphingomonadaceae bacterium TaxID=169976 RepID=A0A6J4RWE9_9SPHN|nr:MAG: hypothetical protein AVDCRST_MAG39-210 [uncultured Sphingomonadaceae bacterium]
MLVYWTMFALPAVTALTARTREVGQYRFQLWLVLLLAAFTVVIGFRYEVGGDWYTYEEIISDIYYGDFRNAFAYVDPGFGLLSFVSTRVGLGSLGPMLACGAVLMFGIYRFSRKQSDPWLAITAAVPYLIIVVGMGYVRQAAAIGFLLVALTKLEGKSLKGFLSWLAVGALFHASVLCTLPIVGLAWARTRGVAVFVVLAAATVLTYAFLLRERVDGFLSSYVEAQMDSSGALVRLAMNGIPAAIFLLLRRFWPMTEDYRFVWTLFAAVALGMFVVVYYSPATTALDRIGLYFIPIQLFVFGNIGAIAGRNTAARTMISIGVIAFYAAVLYIWLNFAVHSEYWLPYQVRPIGG